MVRWADLAGLLAADGFAPEVRLALASALQPDLVRHLVRQVRDVVRERDNHCQERWFVRSP